MQEQMIGEECPLVAVKGISEDGWDKMPRLFQQMHF